MSTITVTFDPPTPADSPSAFNTKAFATLGDLNTWSTQANTVAGEVNTNASTASTAATTATTQAGTATSAASTASSAASSATTSASTATTQASNASSSASAAAISESNAAASAAATAGAIVAERSASRALTNLTGITVVSGGASISGNVSVTGQVTTTDNVGVGVTPSAWGSAYKAIQTYGAALSGGTSLPTFCGVFANCYGASGLNKYTATGEASLYQQYLGAHSWHSAPSGTAGDSATFTECGRFDASGNFLVGTTSLLTNGSYFATSPGNSWSVFAHASGTASGIEYARFTYNNTTIGSITQSGTTAVAYNTTSDHRLKTNVRPSNAARFMDIAFVDFEWVDGRHDCGVIADQLQSVYPDLVIGEKDATDVRAVEITPAVPAVTEQRLVTPAVPAVQAVEAADAVEGSPAEYTTIETSEIVLIDGVETTVAKRTLVETKAAVIAKPAVEAVEAIPAVEAVYETVEVTPAIPAVTEDQTFPVYQQVNYMGLIGRMGTRVQQLQRTVDALEARLAALESA